jgi:hypothetical protein
MNKAGKRQEIYARVLYSPLICIWCWYLNCAAFVHMILYIFYAHSIFSWLKRPRRKLMENQLPRVQLFQVQIHFKKTMFIGLMDRQH